MSRQTHKIMHFLIKYLLITLETLIISISLSCSSPAPKSNTTEVQEPVTLPPAAEVPPAGTRLIADIINPQLIQTQPHLENLNGHIVLGNEHLQLVVSGVSLGAEALKWTPLIVAAYTRANTGWTANDCFRSLDFRRNWTNNRPLETKVTAVIPSIENGIAKLDILYEVKPTNAVRKEFVRVYLRERDPKLYIITDHAQFEKQRTTLEGRIGFRAQINAKDFFQPHMQTNGKSSAIGFDCRGHLMSVIGSTFFKPTYYANGQLEFLSTGRNAQGWEGFLVSLHDTPALNLHLDNAPLHTCAAAQQNTIEGLLEGLNGCGTPVDYPKLTVQRPDDDMARPRRCLKLQNTAYEELNRVCFKQGEGRITLTLAPDTNYLLYDMETGQVWGGTPPLNLSSGEQQQIDLPNIPPRPKE